MKIEAKPGCCEEAAPIPLPFYVPCNEPATHVLWCDRDNRHYRMCDMCTYHNLKRGMIDVTNKKPKLSEV